VLFLFGFVVLVCFWVVYMFCGFYIVVFGVVFCFCFCVPFVGFGVGQLLLGTFVCVCFAVCLCFVWDVHACWFCWFVGDLRDFVGL